MSEGKVLEIVNNANNSSHTDIVELLNAVTFTIDPKLDNLVSNNELSPKAVTAKKIFTNYRKTQV
jgi:hypothetical protein